MHATENNIHLNYFSGSSRLSPSIIMVIVCHWSSSGENIICFPQQTMFKGNLLTVEEGFGRPSDVKRDRAIPKPELYEALLHLLSTRGQWVLDPLGGNGELIRHITCV